ncbi:MAG: GNAT family N-acetyltransferase [Aquimarina sp.]|nr:GNAT family N-acetyltransferase [Aquimarina sp.]
MSFMVRKAERQDMPQVLDLIKELAVFEKEPDAVEVTVEDLEKEGYGNNPLFHCFVAELDEKIVGIALVYYRFSTWKGRTIHLEDLIVSESHRGTGIGMALYKKVMEFADDNKVKRVEWNVLDWNTNAIEFYENTGAHILDDWRVVQMSKEGLDNFVNKYL